MPIHSINNVTVKEFKPFSLQDLQLPSKTTSLNIPNILFKENKFTAPVMPNIKTPETDIKEFIKPIPLDININKSNTVIPESSFIKPEIIVSVKNNIKPIEVKNKNFIFNTEQLNIPKTLKINSDIPAFVKPDTAPIKINNNSKISIISKTFVKPDINLSKINKNPKPDIKTKKFEKPNTQIKVIPERSVLSFSVPNTDTIYKCISKEFKKVI
jgi:hypothetical protein